MNALKKLITESSHLSDESLARNADALLHIHTEEIQTDGKDTFHVHRYEPTPYRVLQVLFNHLDICERDTLLDYGSGLGRLPFYANYLFQCHGIGVEQSEEFHRMALKNQNRYRGIHRDRLSFVHASAEEYELPDEVNYIYCFNPFSTDIFRSVITKIETSFERNEREITLILYYPEDSTIFYIERHTPFHLLCEVPVPDLIGRDRRERFCLYRLSDACGISTDIDSR